VENLSGFPYGAVEFGKRGEIVDRSGFDEVLAEVANGPAPDVFVLSHGWNNDMAEARALYTELAERLRAVLDSSPPAGLGDRRYVLVGVLWPSKKWADRALIPGGAAALGGGVADDELTARLDELRGVFDPDGSDDRLGAAKALVPQLQNSPQAQDEFVRQITALLPEAAHVNPDDADYTPDYLTQPGRETLAALSNPVMVTPPPSGGDVGGAAELGVGGAARTTGDGGAAGLSLSFSGIKAAAERFLNLTTYYQMKERAGTVGADGLNPLLRELRAVRDDLRLHLAGHSFGGRLVTAATAGTPGRPNAEPDTVTLLQAAFSHYGFAEHYDGDKDGFFRRIVTGGMTRGPVLITHSKRDVAVGYAYAVASRLAGQVAAALGDAHDKFGGIGRNGAQKTPEAVEGSLQPVGATYGFSGAALYNLGADDLIMGHSDIRKPEVAYAILSAVATSQ
jgi:hypothetical protein